MSSNGARIVVIGGGMAGLSAAERLHKSGFRNVTILEGSDRLGGRMHTANFGRDSNCKVELGANWIHGSSAANVVYELASQFGLMKNAPLLNRMEGNFYNSSGVCIPKNMCLTIWKHFQSWEYEIEANQVEKGTRVTTREESLKNQFSKFLNESSEIPKDQHTNAKSVFNCFLNYYRFHVGGYLEDMLVGDGITDSYEEIAGGNVKVPCGMSNIINILQESTPEMCIKLNRHVVLIQWHENQEAPVVVTCKNGEEYPADHVIVTSSLGYMKRHHKALFEPHLPNSKAKSICSMAMGKVNKIFLLFDEPFWTPGVGSIKLAWGDFETTAISSLSHWYRRIFAFDEVLNNSNILVAWLSGDEAEDMEALSDNEVIATCVQILRTFLANPSLTAPVSILRSKWCTNPFALGSYSYISKQSTPEDINLLAEPLVLNQVPRILFAGEATSVHHYSTMHGARGSGIREAERIIQTHTGQS